MSQLTKTLNKSPAPGVVDQQVLEQATHYIQEELNKRLNQPNPWASLSMLWPPRLVGAVSERQLAGFFGAGMSLAAGLPSWADLLTRYFGLDDEVLEDRDLDDDPLTLAQLAAEQVGYERVQSILREEMGAYSQPTTGHLLLAALKLPFYITTNYDCLFESAWEVVFPDKPLNAVIVNDLDLATGVDIDNIVGAGGSVLLKIHGCVKRDSEQLILTRRDYRTHYRANEKFFRAVRDVLQKYHILFLGFSHKDPEVSRLVEDVIYDYERDLREAVTPAPQPPHFYSLQFDMRSHSPEVFAARGIVALKPPLVPMSKGDARSIALATALCDLDAASTYKVHVTVSLDEAIQNALAAITKDIDEALKVLKGCEEDAIAATQDGAETAWLVEAVEKLDVMAGQGIWLVDDEGAVVDFAVPSGLERHAREQVLTERAMASKRPPPPNGLGWLDDRPYFRSAKTFQDPFVSDLSESIFNGHGTVFLCQPLIDNGQFRGLLFAAAQVGAWKAPIDLAEQALSESRQLILVDSNGILLVPTIGDHNGCIVPIGSKGADEAEEENANKGFQFSRLLELSRRDALVSHVANNIVPLSQDDDIRVLGADLKQYSVIAEVPRSRLKLAITHGIR